MTIEEERQVAAKIEAARRQGVEEGRKRTNWEWSCWEAIKLGCGLIIPIVFGCISCHVGGSFWIGFVIGLLVESFPLWIF